MYYFYILKSEVDKKLYFDFTNDLNKRFQEHQNGLSQSTKTRRPFVLVYYESYRSKSDAMNREMQIKKNGKALGQLKRRIIASIDG